MASVAKGMFGGALPWNLIWIGGVVGAVIIALDELLKKRGVNFRVPVLAAAVGIYLPLDLTMPIFIGGLLTHLVERAAGARGDAKTGEAGDRLHRKGVLFSAGLITGEALMGIVIAIPIVMSGSADVMALPLGLQFGEGIGLVFFAVIGYLLYRIALSGARGAASSPP
jgi:putative OPT family oligopeptide transporter